MSEESHVVILLDLAAENPIPLSTILGCLPPGSAPARILKLTDFRVTPSPTGTPDEWPPVIAAIERLVDAAREEERSGKRCRYWVAGRAGLPAFFHLGYRLTQFAVVTLINQRGTGELDVLPLDPSGAPGADSAPYFVRSPWPSQPKLADLRLSLIVSSRTQISPEQIEMVMASRGTPQGGFVAAHAPASLDAASVLPALRELQDTTAGIRTWYPGCGSLAVFIAGPATLAFLVGRSINLHIFPDVWVFQHRNNQYQLAYKTQSPRSSSNKHTILFLASNPKDTSVLALAAEARDIREELQRSGYRDRFDFEPRGAVRPLDLLREMRKLQPTIVHFSGHGGQAGLYFEGDDGTSQPVTSEALAKAFDAAGKSVRAVILSACYSEAQAKELCTYVDCVVGISQSISDHSARYFALGFYGCLGDGGSIKVAYEQGCAAIQLYASSGGAQTKLEVKPGVEAGKITLVDP